MKGYKGLVVGHLFEECNAFTSIYFTQHTNSCNVNIDHSFVWFLWNKKGPSVVNVWWDSLVASVCVCMAMFHLLNLAVLCFQGQPEISVRLWPGCAWGIAALRPNFASSPSKIHVIPLLSSFLSFSLLLSFLISFLFFLCWPYMVAHQGFFQKPQHNVFSSTADLVFRVTMGEMLGEVFLSAVWIPLGTLLCLYTFNWL